jgi:hypothetical protein
MSKTKEKDAVLEALRALEKLFSKPGTWTRGRFAVDKDGEEVTPSDKKAVKFCAVGGIDRVRSKKWFDYHTRGQIITTLESVIPKAASADFITGYNDHYGRTQSQIVKLIQRAIRRREKEIADEARS